jgi:hypothetical protein
MKFDFSTIKSKQDILRAIVVIKYLATKFYINYKRKVKIEFRDINGAYISNVEC